MRMHLPLTALTPPFSNDIVQMLALEDGGRLYVEKHASWKTAASEEARRQAEDPSALPNNVSFGNAIPGGDWRDAVIVAPRRVNVSDPARLEAVCNANACDDPAFWGDDDRVLGGGTLEGCRARECGVAAWVNAECPRKCAEARASLGANCSPASLAARPWDDPVHVTCDTRQGYCANESSVKCGPEDWTQCADRRASDAEHTAFCPLSAAAVEYIRQT